MYQPPLTHFSNRQTLHSQEFSPLSGEELDENLFESDLPQTSDQLADDVRGTGEEEEQDDLQAMEFDPLAFVTEGECLQADPPTERAVVWHGLEPCPAKKRKTTPRHVSGSAPAGMLPLNSFWRNHAGAAGSAEEGDAVCPARYPNVSWNKLDKNQMESQIFPMKIDLQLLMAELQSSGEATEQDVVCGACLLGLFEGCEEACEGASEAAPPPKFSHLRPTPQEKIGVISSCMHLFHSSCIARWLLIENSCCQCKQRFGAVCYYDKEGIRQRFFFAKRTIQSLSRRSEQIEAAQAAEASEGEMCSICRQRGDTDSLMRCNTQGCEGLSHFYCLDLEERVESWTCVECTVTVVEPPARPPSAAPNGFQRGANRSRSRMITTESRVQRALNEIEIDDLIEFPPPAPRLLPSETLTANITRKSEVSDLILGHVSIGELGGQIPEALTAPCVIPRRKTVQPDIAMMSARPGLTPPGETLHPTVLPRHRKPPSVPRVRRGSDLEAALASIASISQTTERRLLGDVRQAALDPREVFEQEEAIMESDLEGAPEETTPRVRTAAFRLGTARTSSEHKSSASLTISKGFISGAMSSGMRPKSPGGNEERAGNRVLLRETARVSRKRVGVRDALGAETRTASSSGVKVAIELVEVVKDIVERNRPAATSPISTRCAGDSLKLLRARTAYFMKIARESVPRRLQEVAVRYSASAADTKTFWVSKANLLTNQVLAHALLRQEEQLAWFALWNAEYEGRARRPA